MEIKRIEVDFSVCKIRDLTQVNFKDTYWFLSQTDEELSLVCQTEYVPENYTEREDGWKAFRVQGILDFSLIGILKKISTLLANHNISVFVVSTFNTDYILVKEGQYEGALNILETNKYIIV